MFHSLNLPLTLGKKINCKCGQGAMRKNTFCSARETRVQERIIARFGLSMHMQELV